MNVNIPNLRDQISQDILRAIDSTVNYSGNEQEQNRHNWVQITTDRVVAALMNSLPDPIDIPTKYEIKPGETLPITLIDPQESGTWNQQQLDYLTSYSQDSGYNRYYFEYTDYLRGLYMIPQPVLQSEHEEITGRLHGSSSRTEDKGSKGWDDSEDSEESGDKEPSKVR